MVKRVGSGRSRPMQKWRGSVRYQKSPRWGGRGIGSCQNGSARVVNGSGSQSPDSLSQGCISEACRLASWACISHVLCGALGAYTFFLPRSERPERQREWREVERGTARRLPHVHAKSTHRHKPLVGPPFVAFFALRSLPLVVTHMPLPVPEAETLVSFPVAAIQTMQGCWRSAAIAIGE